MNLKADAVLVQVVERVARRDADGADVGQVIDHQLQDLAFGRLLGWGDNVVGDGHRGTLQTVKGR
ncbi:hypothetical protein D3C73_1587000 [compost metagenome]